MVHVDIKPKQIDRVRGLAKKIADQTLRIVKDYSSVSVERTILRLYGVDGVDNESVPLPNKLIDKLKANNRLEDGVSYHFAAAMLKSERDAQTTAELINQGKIELGMITDFAPTDIKKKEASLCEHAINILDTTRIRKKEKQDLNPIPPTPWKYLIVATGNIYEDRTQAKAAVHKGADIIAVIRSTAQSLLDYVPYGATTEGFGGTYATQKNFKIMRKALDEEANESKRYVRLVNYSSGLCMAEIVACSAIEDLDMLLNDSMYGILFRDINQKRTFIDQHFSRMLCSRAKIIINTGEDNYLTTSDAIDNAYTVTASQLINQAMAHNSMLTDDLLGLGHAFEINPQVENAFLLELSHAALARQLFPNCPLKYMPPTKYKSTDVFFSHCMDTMFNLASVTTGQGIHLAGILTEAIHTPLMQDRANALDNINYVFNVARDLGSEIEFKKDGFINNRAQQVLDDVEIFLSKISEIGLMESIALGEFADIKRGIDAGKGLDGIFKKSSHYSNPIMSILEEQGVLND